MSNVLYRDRLLPVYLDSVNSSISIPVTVKHGQDSLFSTTVPLGANSSFTSAIFDVREYDKIVGTLFSDQAGTLKVMFSSDSLNFDAVKNISYYPNAKDPLFFDVVSPYFRIIYENSNIAQSVFRLYVFGKY